MGDVAPHFSRHEFACSCGCGFCAVDVELVCVLEDLREAFGGRPVHINSGCRCERYNARPDVSGSKGSYHCKAMASDVWIDDAEPDALADYLEAVYPGRYGIGRYNDFTHIDVRPSPARWDNRT
jgi:uncharacterized protein YcbK (DUF882 family)